MFYLVAARQSNRATTTARAQAAILYVNNNRLDQSNIKRQPSNEKNTTTKKTSTSSNISALFDSIATKLTELPPLRARKLKRCQDRLRVGWVLLGAFLLAFQSHARSQLVSESGSTPLPFSTTPTIPTVQRR